MSQILIDGLLPGLFLAALLIGLLVIAGRLAGARSALWREQRRELIRRAERAAARTAEHRQAAAAARDAIAATITELRSRPATYDTFPRDVLDLLHDAHTRSRHLELPGDNS